MKFNGVILDGPESRPSLLRDAVTGTAVILAFTAILIVVGGAVFLLAERVGG